MASSIFIGAADGRAQSLLLARANRHGLIAGATGTGKTVTLQVLAEGLSAAGVPVFMADVKGDLAGMAAPGSRDARQHDALVERAAAIGLAGYAYASFPVMFWDLFGEAGHPVRATVSEMGPLLIARLLGLNDTQSGVLEIAFRVADEEGLLLLDLKDLRSMLADCSARSKELSARYGNVSRASVGAIQRRLLQLDGQGGDRFFGEPALAIADLMRVGPDGRGQVNILAAERLMSSPRLYATFLLWLLAELFEELPEVGDPEKPVLVFFFDEAHLLFDDAPRALLDKVEQVTRLIRSKGVGVFFVTQNPADIPERVAAQLGNRVQHALRAFTPKEAKAVRAAADTFRANPAIDTAGAITELRTGEALVSVLGADGAPTPVERTLVAPPRSRLGSLGAGEREAVIVRSELGDRYARTLDRQSAHEMLAARAVNAASEAERAGVVAPRRAAPRARASIGEAMVTSAARSVASSVGRQLAGRFGASLLRGLFGSRRR